ncbi:MAG: hypothetical protein ACYC2U_08325 [Candidatus Amoebophilus sp.]
MKETKQQPIQQANILEKGYRPIGRLDTSKPPQGASVVPSKPTIPVQNKSR